MFLLFKSVFRVNFTSTENELQTMRQRQTFLTYIQKYSRCLIFDKSVKLNKCDSSIQNHKMFVDCDIWLPTHVFYFSSVYLKHSQYLHKTFTFSLCLRRRKQKYKLTVPYLTYSIYQFLQKCIYLFKKTRNKTKNRTKEHIAFGFRLAAFGLFQICILYFLLK